MLCCLPALRVTLLLWLIGQVEAPEIIEPPKAPSTGAFSRLLREKQFLKPGILTVTGKVEGKTFLPADFERHDALVLVADRLAKDFPELLARIVAEAKPKIELIGLFSDTKGRDAVRRVLAEHNPPPDSIRLIEVPTDTVWIRDFGPVVVRRGDGTRVAFDFQYKRRSGAKNRDTDNAAAAAIARHVGIPVRRVPVELEPGNLLSNGRGLLVTTTDTFNANISHGYDAGTIAGYLGKTFGCRKIVLLEPLKGERTGHVDVFACFTDPDTIVVGEYPKSVDPVNAGVLERNAAILSKVQTADGPLRVVRIPMPGNEDGAWRSYTNSIFANGVLLVPSYGGAHAEADNRAVLAFRRLLPGWKVTGIDASKVVRREGALRCITSYVPVKRAADAGK